MELFLRNRSLKLQLLFSCFVSLAGTWLAWAYAGRRAGLICGLICLAISAIGLALAWWRLQRINHLIERIDMALHDEASLNMNDMHEGELSLLAHQIDKTFNKLTVVNTKLLHERQSLADSLADISHQLRTPMTSLGLELELMRKSNDTDDLRRRVRHSQQLVDRMQWLIESLLRLARIDAGVITLAHSDVSVEKLMRDVILPFEISLDLQNISLELDVEEGLHFKGDAAWSCEALRNILKNCIEHTPPQGTITISAKQDPIACRISIVDTGPGFTSEDLPHIFERFYRGRSHTSTGAGSGANSSPNGSSSGDSNTSPSASPESPVNPSGVGIGLSLAQALIHAQDGTIRASNRRDAQGSVCGARFDVSFYRNVV